ncbi:septal ring lytic transglycosylase RlpA family protein [Microvirga rosea]|uniref:septal ring lytic transglycosylase RlpA family protein n=1 Tax=Microvirga rosea TaxID=2715425 RepID=UPI001D0A6023|nr:septal ring lytic transglycosylase RlpA family protein [Microvirga rosea]MCB8822980.1 septal ring lytic transglycosylase RlpA family protein [Microvirga rosea]
MSQVADKAFQSGTASWYGPGFHGRRTASGERFNSFAMTAAHRSLPFGTKVRVVNEKNGRSVVVTVNDRGPFSRRRIIDLAKGPAQELGLTSSGTAYVSLHRIGEN